MMVGVGPRPTLSSQYRRTRSRFLRSGGGSWRGRPQQQRVRQREEDHNYSSTKVQAGWMMCSKTSPIGIADLVVITRMVEDCEVMVGCIVI
jgi:hypothetical protein